MTNLLGNDLCMAGLKSHLFPVKVWDKSGLTIILPKQPLGWSVVVECSGCCGSMYRLFCSLRATTELLYSFLLSSCHPQSSLCFMTFPAVTCCQATKPVASMGQCQLPWGAAAPWAPTNHLALEMSLVVAPTPAEDLMKCW